MNEMLQQLMTAGPWGMLVGKATLAMLLAFALAAAARRARASVRHLVFAALFAFLLLLPFASRYARSPVRDIAVEVPHSGSVIAAELATVGGVDPEPVASPAARRLSIRDAYFAVTALLLAWLALGVWRLNRMAARGAVWLEGTMRMNELAHDAGIRRAALVVLSDETAVPLTFGFRRATILLPHAARGWSDDELRCALRHELEHVRRDDWAMQLMARAACAFYWAHPLVWAAWRRFCFEAERACDDAVLGTFAGAEEYADQLVGLARHARFSTIPALGMASRSRLSQRVHALLDASQRRGRPGSLVASLMIAATLALLLTLAPVRLIAAAKDDGEPARKWSPIGEKLAEAGEQGRIDIIRQFLDAGIDVNTVAEGDGTALIGASRGGHIELVRFLIDRGADIDLASPGDGNPLIMAARYGHLGIVRILLDEGANLDTVVAGDENPLIQAAWHGHEDVARLLIERGADVNARAYERGELRTPLRMARKEAHDTIVQWLLAAGARE